MSICGCINMREMGESEMGSAACCFYLHLWIAMDGRYWKQLLRLWHWNSIHTSIRSFSIHLVYMVYIYFCFVWFGFAWSFLLLLLLLLSSVSIHQYFSLLMISCGRHSRAEYIKFNTYNMISAFILEQRPYAKQIYSRINRWHKKGSKVDILIESTDEVTSSLICNAFYLFLCERVFYCIFGWLYGDEVKLAVSTQADQMHKIYKAYKSSVLSFLFLSVVSQWKKSSFNKHA